MSQTSSPVPQATTPAFRGRLARRMVFILVPLSLFIMAVLGWYSAREAQHALQEQTGDQLRQAEDTMKADLNEWLLSKSARLDTVAHRRGFAHAAHQLLTAFHEDPRFSAAQQEAIAELADINRYQTFPVFNDFLIISPDGAILASSRREWEGLQTRGSPLYKLIQHISAPAAANGGLGWLTKIAPANSTFAPDPFGGVHFLTHNYSPLPSEKERTLLFSVLPYADRVSGKKAYLVGVSEEIALEQRLNQLASRYPSSHAYFLLYDGAYLTLDPETHTLKALKNVPALLEQGFTPSNESPEGEIEGTYTSPLTRQKVFTLARWVPAMNAAIGLEIPAKLFAGRAQAVLPTVLRGFLIAALVLALVVWLTISYITRPLMQITDTARRFADGDWLQRAPVQRNDEIGMLAHAFNQMADELSEFYRSLEAQVEERTAQLRAASEVATVATSASDLREILRRSVELITEHFPQYYHASVFLIDENGDAVLEESTGEVGAQMKQQGHRLKVGSPSVVGWAAAHKQPRVASDVTDDPIHFKNPLLPETRSEAGIPLLIGNEVLGVLDVQSKDPNAFNEQSLATLQTLAGQLAAAIYNARMRQQAEIGYDEVRLLFQISRRLAETQNVDDIMEVAQSSLQNLPFIAAMYAYDPDAHTYRLTATHHPQEGSVPAAVPTLNMDPESLRRYLPPGTPLVLKDLQSAIAMPERLAALAKSAGCRSAAFLPIYNGDILAAVFLLGSETPGALSAQRLQPYITLSEIANAALQRTVALATAQRRLQEMQTLMRLAESVGETSTPEAFYETLRRELHAVFGEVGIIVARYDPLRRRIEIPYAYEQGQGHLHIEPFPLGEGLLSRVISARQTLLLADNVEQRARELGAKVVGKPAQSWLGVPLITGDQLIGALVLQDTAQTHRFGRADAEFVEAIATSVALLLHKIYLLARTEAARQRERVLLEISEAAGRAQDIGEVLETALRSLQRSLHIRRGVARLQLGGLQAEETAPTTEGNDDHA